MNIEQEAAAAVKGWFHPDMKENSMTVTAPEQAAPDGAAPLSFWQMLHRNLTIFDASVVRFLPHLEKIATDPRLDAAVEALLVAADAGVAAEVFEFVTDSLRSAAARKTVPAVDGGTGEQAAQTAQTAAM